MTDEELAGRVHEIRKHDAPIAGCDWQTADELVCDWRVVGALMEKTIKDDRIDLRCVSGSWMPSLERFDACVASSATPTYGVYLDRSSESLPRAIIEACVTVLDKEK